MGSDSIEPASSHTESAIIRIDEAFGALRKLATTSLSADSESLRTHLAAPIAEALRALSLARQELLRSEEIVRVESARERVQAYISKLHLDVDEETPYIGVVVAPLPIDDDRFDVTGSTDDFRIVVNRLAIELQMKSRPFHNWLITAPSASYARREDDSLRFFVDVGDGARFADLRVFDTGGIVFRRPIYRWSDLPGVNLEDVSSDVAATLVFARNFFAETLNSPVQVAAQLVLAKMNDFVLSSPHAILRGVNSRPIESPEALFPKRPLIKSFADFVINPTPLGDAVISDLKTRYAPLL